MLNFFYSGKFLRVVNTVTLVPKVQDANKAMDFRPISGGNTMVTTQDDVDLAYLQAQRF